MFRKPIDKPKNSSLFEVVNAAINAYLNDESNNFWKGQAGKDRARQYKMKIAGKNDFNLLCKVYLDVTAKQNDGDLSSSSDLRLRLMLALCAYLKIAPEQACEKSLSQALFDRFKLSNLEWNAYLINYERENVVNNAMYRDSFAYTLPSLGNLACQAKIDFVRAKLSANEIELHPVNKI